MLLITICQRLIVRPALGREWSKHLVFWSTCTYVGWSDVTYLWSQCDRHFVGQRVVLCVVKWWRFVVLFLLRKWRLLTSEQQTFRRACPTKWRKTADMKKLRHCQPYVLLNSFFNAECRWWVGSGNNFRGLGWIGCKTLGWVGFSFHVQLWSCKILCRECENIVVIRDAKFVRALLGQVSIILNATLCCKI